MNEAQELRATCARYSKNFSALEGKFEATTQQLMTEQAKSGQLAKQLSVVNEELVHSQEEFRRLVRDAEELQQYKDKYYAANVALEHWKGRMDSARKAAGDRETEYRHEADQLRAQMKDLSKRVENNSDHQLANALKAQKVELEERCAALNGQLMEERERCNNELVTHAQLVKELQSRTLELEQRCRMYEGELQAQRTTHRNASESYVDTTAENERLQLEVGRVSREASALRQELSRAESVADEKLTKLEDEWIGRRREWDKDRDIMQQKIESLTQQLSDATRCKEDDEERIRAQQRTMQRKLSEARDENRLELEGALKQKTDAEDEVQRLRWRLKQREDELDNTKSELSQTAGKIAALDQQKQQLQCQVEVAIQQESWAVAEKERATIALTRMQQKLDELNRRDAENESKLVEAERLRLSVNYLESDLQNALAQLRQDREAHHTMVESVKQQYTERMQVLVHEQKEMRRVYKSRMGKFEKENKRIFAALLKAENRSTTAGAADRVLAGESAGDRDRSPRLGSGTAGEISPRASSPGKNILATLRAQTDAATELRKKLMEFK